MCFRGYLSLLLGRLERGLNLHRHFPVLWREADLGRGGLREVEVPPLGVRPAVRDLHSDGLATLQVRDLVPARAERQGRVSRRQPVPGKPRATGRQPAVKALAVEGGLTDLFDDVLPCGRPPRPYRIFDQVVAAFLLFRPPAVAGHLEGHSGSIIQERVFCGFPRAKEGGFPIGTERFS